MSIAIETLEKQLRIEENILDVADRHIAELTMSLQAAKGRAVEIAERCQGIRKAIGILRGKE